MTLCTTRSAGLHGHEISIANLGDSRAYLITRRHHRATDRGRRSRPRNLLANGAAPEEVRELGVTARSLRECVGRLNAAPPNGALAILNGEARSRSSRAGPLLARRVCLFWLDERA